MNQAAPVSGNGVYIHIPFCLQKCAYCDFASRPLQNAAEMADYFQALQSEIQIRANGKAETVFFGGGTPSLAEPQQLESVLKTLQQTMRISEETEISLEANPATLDLEKLGCLRRLGINRLSIGIQSTEDRSLQVLGRCHTASQGRQLFFDARAAGFSNISCDLIYGLPGQTLTEFEKNLQTLVQWNPEHISLYALSVENDTPLFHSIQDGFLSSPNDDLVADMYIWARDYLKASNYSQYELSNFCQKGFACQHNSLYWKNKDYLGLGAAAHSYEFGVRKWNVRDPQLYIEKIRKDGNAEAGRECLKAREKIAEFLMLRLRMTTGVTKQEIQENFGKNWESDFILGFEKMKKQGLLSDEKSVLQLTPEGMLLSNVVFREIL